MVVRASFTADCTVLAVGGWIPEISRVPFLSPQVMPFWIFLDTREVLTATCWEGGVLVLGSWVGVVG
jgi:hypothetical protein